MTINQKGGRDSTNIQADSITLNNGLSYQEVKEIALDIFKANFYDLAGEAKVIAETRAEEITEKTLRRLTQENPKAIEESRDPDFQYGLYTVQREYARSGDEELGDILVDLLVDRSKQTSRNLLQIVLNESLNIAPKLTDDQLATLSVSFYLSYCQNQGIRNLDMFAKDLDRFIKPFIKKLSTKSSCYQHLEYSSCGSISNGRSDLCSIWISHYPGLFNKGFDQKVLEERGISDTKNPGLFFPCIHDNEKLQVRALSEMVLNGRFKELGTSEEDKKRIIDLFKATTMNSQEVRKLVTDERDYVENLLDIWNNSSLGSFTLTSVGIAIGHANLKRVAGKFTDLKTWIE